MSISLEHYLILGVILFCMGLISLLVNSANLLRMLMGGEIMALGALLIFATFSKFYHTVEGVVFCLIILALAAVKLAVGIALIFLHFQQQKTLHLERKHLSQ